MTEQDTEKKTNKPRRDWIGIVLDVIALTPIAIAVFIGGMYLFPRIGRFMPFWFANWFAGIAGPFLVLGFDILWIIGMKKWQPKSDQIRVLKKIISVTIYAFSASVLVSWYIIYLFDHVW
ncbi:MAG: hypothetical protein JW749_00055 [Sedimentisphaerales bacterium]|nr:hypothetical protein [Sedimentisphaerales bacterium]